VGSGLRLVVRRKKWRKEGAVGAVRTGDVVWKSLMKVSVK
jgi:hypothetical protein